MTEYKGVANCGQYLAVSVFHLIAIMCPAYAEEPRFSEPIPNVTVALGRDASLPCVVENLGKFKVAWIHIDRQMILTIHRHVIARVPRFSVSHDNQKTWLLHVNGVQQEDRGYYMCQVNTNPMISQVGYLQVVVPPNIVDEQSTESSVAVREHQNMTLTCKAEGFPTPKIMWRREDGQGIAIDRRKKVNIYDGETLHLMKISRLEMGAYLCIASNGVPPSVSKRIIVDVEFSPMIWVPNQLVGAPAGTEVTIDCHVEAHPRTISYWVYENVMLLPTKKYVTELTENSYRAHMRLTVRGLQPGDFGNYRCISKNSLGETEGSVRLYELPQPSSSMAAKDTKTSGNSVSKEVFSKKSSGKASDHKKPASFKVFPEDSKQVQTERTATSPPLDSSPNSKLMEKDKEGKKIISIDLDDGDDDADDAHLSYNNLENANFTVDGINGNTTGKKNKKITKAVKDILTNNNMKFMSNFDPELSNRERRKLTRKFNGEGKKNGLMCDENGISSGFDKDVCDCLIENCPGCHFPCPKCRSCKCGVDCRVNRKWVYEAVENEAEVAVAKNMIPTI